MRGARARRAARAGRRGSIAPVWQESPSRETSTIAGSTSPHDYPKINSYFPCSVPTRVGMLLQGTVVADSETGYEDGALVVEEDCIVAVGERDEITDAYPDHE